MKKTSFYSLHQGNKAIMHDGYTDGRFWYYKHGCTWFAIYPESGTAIATAPTRKTARELAAERLEKAVTFYDAHPELIKEYNKAFARAILCMD